MTEQTPNVLIQNITGEINLINPIDIVDQETGEVLSSGIRNITTMRPDGLGILNNGIDASRLSGIVFSGDGLVYDNLVDVKAISWENLAVKVAAIAAVSQAGNSTTLNVNSAIQIQYGETIAPPTQTITISSDASGNRLAIDGDYGLPNQLLTSGGPDAGIHWGTGSGGSVGTLADVLTNSNVANRPIDMAGYNLENIGELRMAADPVPLSELTSTRMAMPITMNGVVYYIPVFTSP